MQLPPDWSEFLSALKRHGVRFLLVGAHALAAHGRPRATQDLDVLVAPTAANARRVVAALAEFGFAEFAADWRWFTKPYRVTMLGRIPLRIVILTGISGVSFAVAWKNRITMATEIGDVAVLGLADLRANKRAAGRPKDLLDLALLDELALATPSRFRSTRVTSGSKSASRAKGASARRRRSR
jgi:hypothetical protein